MKNVLFVYSFPSFIPIPFQINKEYVYNITSPLK